MPDQNVYARAQAGTGIGGVIKFNRITVYVQDVREKPTWNVNI